MAKQSKKQREQELKKVKEEFDDLCQWFKDKKKELTKKLATQE